MYLTRHTTIAGGRWALDGKYLPVHFNLNLLLELPKANITNFLKSLPLGEVAAGDLLPPLEATHEVWACGVTYLRSRDARQAESDTPDMYGRVYEAERPEIFFKALGWRVAGHGMPIRARQDSSWDVPEPELTLVVNRLMEIVGFTVGNDVSSRSIEGENPLYLPQAKTYRGSCAIGPGIQLAGTDELRDVPIQMNIVRAGRIVFEGEIRSSQMKRSLEELVAYLGRELDFPHGVLLMTGTSLVPSDEFTLQAGDVVQITINGLTLENLVQA
jgi:2-dehydro-3-deoxy-D-arabinonate dehydratase